ncbi:MAG: 16S rRNA (adenine(1518)-N(6)/adenine(1519)-N(6))-dimethyltransferase RsmA [Syntrophomonadaceae bacterium]
MNPATVKEVRAALNEYGLHPRKKWGQNFLVDKNILKKIADGSDIDPDGYVVEIGPGLGALTRELALRCRGVLAIEIDRQLQGFLEHSFEDLPGVHFLFADVLTINLEQALADAFDLKEIKPYSVCANIPYNITSPILFKLLEECVNLKNATLMMQKEVADRIIARPGGKDYGLLTLTTAYYARVSPVAPVSRNCFYPKPEVDSQVIKITPHQVKPVLAADEKRLKEFLKAAFQKRRKTILNICADFFHKDKQSCTEILMESQIAPLRRPETLELGEFALLLEVFSR